MGGCDEGADKTRYGPGIGYGFFFNDTATTEIYALSLHDALPIFFLTVQDSTPTTPKKARYSVPSADGSTGKSPIRDRKSTRLNSSHANISYAVFCLKKKRLYSTYLTLSSLHLCLQYNSLPPSFLP